VTESVTVGLGAGLVFGILAIIGLVGRRTRSTPVAVTSSSTVVDRQARSTRCHADIDRLVSEFLKNSDGDSRRSRRFPAKIKASFPSPAHREWRHLDISSIAGWIYRDEVSTFVLAIGCDGDWAFVGTYYYQSAGREHPESWPVSRKNGFQEINEYEVKNVVRGYVDPEAVVECFRIAVRMLLGR